MLLNYSTALCISLVYEFARIHAATGMHQCYCAIVRKDTITNVGQPVDNSVYKRWES